MNIAVIIPSRGRALSLKAVLVALHSLASGENKISYTVLADKDDPDTAWYIEDARDMLEGTKEAPTGNTLTIIQDDNCLIQVRENEIAPTLRADAYMPWADDLFPMAQNWDAIIQYAIEEANVPAFSWREANDPTNHTAIVISKVWYEATGRLFPDYFPFWFADTWMKEVFQFAFGAGMPIIEQLGFGGKRGATGNMHDLSFWFRVFAETRDERIEDASKVCKAMQLAMPDHTEAEALFARADMMQLRAVPRYEKAFSAGSRPQTEFYKEAKARAERLFPQLMEAA